MVFTSNRFNQYTINVRDRALIWTVWSIRLYNKCFGSFWATLTFFFAIYVSSWILETLKKKFKTSAGLKMVVFWMKYEHQINWANAYGTNLDDCTGRSVRNAWIGLLSTLTLHPPEWMANFEVCTLYDRKKWTNSYDFLRIKRVHALVSSVSFKPTFVDFTLVIDMLALLQFSYCHGQCFYFILFYFYLDST